MHVHTDIAGSCQADAWAQNLLKNFAETLVVEPVLAPPVISQAHHDHVQLAAQRAELVPEPSKVTVRIWDGPFDAGAPS